MSDTNWWLQIGDVFTSPELADCQYDVKYEDGVPFVDKRELQVHHPRAFEVHWTERRGDWSRERVQNIDVSAHDPSRGTARFVVEHAESSGGGTPYGEGVPFADGWQVRARRLHPDGSYDSEGEVVRFCQADSDGGSLYGNSIRRVEKVGAMKIAFH